MNLNFSGQESIPRSKAEVWAFINDPANIAASLPDVTALEIKGDRAFDATVQISVGPVRGKFKFKITLLPKDDGEHMNMNINGGGFGSVVDLVASSTLQGDDRSTTLDWEGTATMRGPIATIGGRVLDAQARHVIATTFGNIKQRLTGVALT